MRDQDGAVFSCGTSKTTPSSASYGRRLGQPASPPPPRRRGTAGFGHINMRGVHRLRCLTFNILGPIVNPPAATKRAPSIPTSPPYFSQYGTADLISSSVPHRIQMTPIAQVAVVLCPPRPPTPASIWRRHLEPLSQQRCARQCHDEPKLISPTTRTSSSVKSDRKVRVDYHNVRPTKLYSLTALSGTE